MSIKLNLMFKLHKNIRTYIISLPRYKMLVVIPGRTMSLEQRALSWARRYPWQLCGKQQPPTRHIHTDQVSGDTYQPNYSGLKVNDQLVAFATSFSAVRLKNRVVAPPRLKSQSMVRLLQCLLT